MTTPELAPSFRITPTQLVDVCPPTCDLACSRSGYTADLRWNRVSNLESFGPRSGALPLGHRGPINIKAPIPQFHARSTVCTGPKHAKSVEGQTSPSWWGEEV
ncbi:hypothetical protein AVEN_151049-1 [Araneus ventricosus]|uniref:Uncharacterized protein n=1 Tax=Araneus ventricosus TaxID=182803 RepID=A0A4Y2WM54_ARAVE|nr:hypothetical protein AVEN_81229-1 [Araneus ventricosus]GBO37776.1 hypothetical protein AVEN_107761-1 [Araneus ventricosus]GBO37777.1 hypothetical protein AVEN_141957-1 [Araneus ventricosus]GBO37780.1 hypothetical protein AVEN_151049-1 [Araneus ventricosus]